MYQKAGHATAITVIPCTRGATAFAWKSKRRKVFRSAYPLTREDAIYNDHERINDRRGFAPGIIATITNAAIWKTRAKSFSPNRGLAESCRIRRSHLKQRFSIFFLSRTPLDCTSHL